MGLWSLCSYLLCWQIAAQCDEALLTAVPAHKGLRSPIKMDTVLAHGWYLYKGCKNALALDKSLDSMIAKDLTALWCYSKRLNFIHMVPLIFTFYFFPTKYLCDGLLHREKCSTKAFDQSLELIPFCR